MSHIVSVKDDFGAVGDGVANDSQPFQKMVEYVNNSPKGGITIIIPEGTYCIQWDWFDENGDETPLNQKYFQNCTGISIIGQNATIKIINGAKCGRFNLDGGIDPQQGKININEGWGLRFDKCRKVYIQGLNFEGNVENLDYGIDKVDGRGIALYFQGCEDVLVENCIATNFGTDGVKIVYSEDKTVSSRRISLRNIRTSGNRHAGIDINACIGAEIVNCEFRNTGKPLRSGTTAGGIIEPAGGFPCEQIVFTNCIFEGNKQFGFICDDPNKSNPDMTDGLVKDILLLNCRFIALDGDLFSAWAARRTIRFVSCRFFGTAVHFYGEALKCYFENDHEYFAGNGPNNVCLVTDGDIGLKLRDCTFVAKGGRRLINLNGSTTHQTRKIIEGCTFIVDGNELGNTRTYAGRVQGKVVLRRCNFLKTGDDPTDYYHISLDEEVFDVDSYTNSSKLLFRYDPSGFTSEESRQSTYHLEGRWFY